MFRHLVLGHLNTRQASLLDLGAGSGIVPHMDFRGLAKRVCGVDPDPRVLENPFLDEGRVANGERLPFADEEFDVVIANNVLEHLQDPQAVFAEVRRVLKPGGVFLAKTPNRWHYVPLVSSVTPLEFHKWVNERRGRNSHDTFATFYRANSKAALHRLARRAGFREIEIGLIEGRPEYLRWSAVTYAVGIVFERVVNRFQALEGLRVVILAEFFV